RRSIHHPGWLRLREEYAPQTYDRIASTTARGGMAHRREPGVRRRGATRTAASRIWRRLSEWRALWLHDGRGKRQPAAGRVYRFTRARQGTHRPGEVKTGRVGGRGPPNAL